jgi:uncharacterized protein YbjT (DUF2867 family)
MSTTSIVLLGASGAVGTQTMQTLLEESNISRLTLLGRTPIEDVSENFVKQHRINALDANSYADLLAGHDVAICTFGVGEPSKISKEEFVKIDKMAVLDFAKACKKAGITHFQLLASVGVDAKSSSYYLKTKGELVDELIALNFERLSIFQPSVILTPTNRYGFSQAVLLAIFPLLKPMLFGSLKKYRGIPVEILGKAIAKNTFTNKSGLERLEWEDFYALAKQ